MARIDEHWLSNRRGLSEQSSARASQAAAFDTVHTGARLAVAVPNYRRYGLTRSRTGPRRQGGRGLSSRRVMGGFRSNVNSKDRSANWISPTPRPSESRVLEGAAGAVDLPCRTGDARGPNTTSNQPSASGPAGSRNAKTAPAATRTLTGQRTTPDRVAANRQEDEPDCPKEKPPNIGVKEPPAVKASIAAAPSAGAREVQLAEPTSAGTIRNPACSL